MQEPGCVAEERRHQSGEIQASAFEGAGNLVVSSSKSRRTGDGLREGFMFMVLLRRVVDQG
jgi:hypothetical protein